MLSGMDRHPDHPDTPDHFFTPILIPGIDFSLRIIWKPCQDSDFMPAFYKLRCNLIDLKLLGIVILADNENFHVLLPSIRNRTICGNNIVPRNGCGIRNKLVIHPMGEFIDDQANNADQCIPYHFKVVSEI